MEHADLFPVELLSAPRYRRTRLDWPENGIVGHTFMDIRTADGKQKLSSILFYSKLQVSSPSGILL